MNMYKTAKLTPLGRERRRGPMKMSERCDDAVIDHPTDQRVVSQEVFEGCSVNDAVFRVPRTSEVFMLVELVAEELSFLSQLNIEDLRVSLCDGDFCSRSSIFRCAFLLACDMALARRARSESMMVSRMTPAARKRRSRFLSVPGGGRLPTSGTV